MFNNVSTLKNKITELQLLVDEVKPDVICLQETRTPNELKLDGYIETGSIRPSKERHGARGSKVLIKTNLAHSPVKTNLSEGLEQLQLDIILPGQKPVCIVGVYMSPRINSECKAKRQQTIAKLLSQLKSNNPTFLVGDFNARMNIAQHARTNPLGEDLTDLEKTGQISTFLPSTFTRYDPAGRDPSILDFTISDPRFANMVHGTETVGDIGSDHAPIITDILIGKRPGIPIATAKPNFDRADWIQYQRIAETLMCEAPPIQGNASSIDEANKFMTRLITSADANAIPRVVAKTGPHRHTLPRPIVTLIQRKKQLRNRFRKRRWETHLKPEINRLDREIKTAIREFEDEKRRKTWEDTMQKDRHGFYKLARKYLGKTPSRTTYPIRKPDGEFASTDLERVAIFEDLYREIYSSPAGQPGYDELSKQAEEYSMLLQNTFKHVQPRQDHDITTEVSLQEILKVLTKTKRTSPGRDGIYYIHIVNLPDPALQYLAHLYSEAIKCCYFPTTWKKGKMILLTKPGKDGHNPRNYRPITLLSALGKTLEKLINRRLVSHLEEKGILPDSQSGFRTNRSTQDQLFRLTQNVSEALQQNMVAMATMFDVEKAYDKVWHDGLLLKMRNCGLSNTTVGLVRSFLVGRDITIVINDAESTPIRLHAGTPQGAILSPTLFNIWVSDIPQPEHRRTKLSQFADDIACWTTAKNMKEAETKLQRFNNRLTAWSTKWRIQLSAAKTKVVKFHDKRIRSKTIPGQTIKGKRIPAEDEVEFLGIVFDKGLTFKKHQEKITKELKRRVHLFAAITGSTARPLAPTVICKEIFRSMIVPVTTYGCAATCIRSASRLAKQDTLLRKAARMAIHAPRSTRNDYLQREIGLETSCSLTTKLAKQYILSDRRTETIKQIVRAKRSQGPNKNERERRTPLNIILSEEQ